MITPSLRFLACFIVMVFAANPAFSATTQQVSANNKTISASSQKKYLAVSQQKTKTAADYAAELKKCPDSASMIKKAWDYLNAGDKVGAHFFATQLINKYGKEALSQQASLKGFASKANAAKYWALNDVATSYFVLANVAARRGQFDETKKNIGIILNKLKYAQCWDTKGFYWKVAEGAKELLKNKKYYPELDKCKDSASLVKAAWKYLNTGEKRGAIFFAQETINRYKDQAFKQQAGLSNFPGPKNTAKFWALNDVGTAYFIMGKALAKFGDKKTARQMFQTVIQKLKYAQCWDTKGWYWKVADGAKKELLNLR
jgi:hypothetical protein